MKNAGIKTVAFIGVLISLCFVSAHAQTTKTYHVSSPDGKITVNVNVDFDIEWSVTYDGKTIITPSSASLSLITGEVLGKNNRIARVLSREVNMPFETPFYKKNRVEDRYNELILRFYGNFSLEFKAYDEGVAYRFTTNKRGEITVVNEEACFNFGEDHRAFVPYVNDMRGGERYTYSFESFYDEIKLSEMAPDSLAITPLLVDLGDQMKAVIMEVDLEDYPGMFLTLNREAIHGLKGEFAPYPLKGEMGGYNQLNFIATERADYIAKTKGVRTFPWRAVVISTDDKQLANNDMAQKLAAPSRVKDVSWIKPGKVAWDWWNNYNLTNVDFVAGINTETYKHYMDFAAANGLEYIIVDWGWYANNTLMETIPEMDIRELVLYGIQKNVDVILWASWELTAKEKDIVFPHYAKMGVKGFKVDFFDSDDQKMMKTIYEIADAAAKHKLLLDLHGMKATGIQRTYPNIVNFEGVKGLENMKWAPIIDGKIKDDMPRYDVTIPFIRMLSGPMDYTPGAMRNATQATYRSINDNPMSQGTRVHQMAMYTIFESPLQMLSDSPTAYKKEKECTDFIAKVPTVFDETIVLDGQVAEYILLARRKGNTWFIGGMTNWDERELTIDFSFLPEGTYEAEIFMDGVNSHRDATDYKREVTQIQSGDKRTIKMYPGGGWTGKLMLSMDN